MSTTENVHSHASLSTATVQLVPSSASNDVDTTNNITNDSDNNNTLEQQQQLDTRHRPSRSKKISTAITTSRRLSIMSLARKLRKPKSTSSTIEIGNTCHPYHKRGKVMSNNTVAGQNGDSAHKRRHSNPDCLQQRGVEFSSSTTTPTSSSLTKPSAAAAAAAAAGGGPTGGGEETTSEDTTDTETPYEAEADPLTLMDSKTMIDNLGDDPTSDELAGIAAIRAKEYIAECLSTEVSSVVDRTMWEVIPQFTKMDLIVGQHLGKGTFSDVFEVIASVVEESEALTRESLNLNSADLDKRIKKKFHSKEAHLDKMGLDTSDATDSTTIEHATKENEKPIPDLNSEDESPPPPPQSNNIVDEGNLPGRASRRHTTELTSTNQTRTSRTLAMKCLRPQTRANMDQFMIGVEDLVNETAMLASLDHPNIIKLHGRAGGCGSDSFRLSDGFFILLDRLRDNLEDRIRSWKKTLAANKKAASPSMSQIKTACAIADALSYLHSKNIVFRDLKPANVGFNSTGVLKLFDFGFAKCVTDPEYPSLERSSSTTGSFDNGNKSEHTDDETQQQSSSPLLFERCGTVRYMAPEVGLDKGYSLPADVYSFGILLWEICSLKKPFDTIKTTSDFEKTVFTKGARPKLSKDWHANLKDVMTTCWLTSSNDRPSMNDVKRNMQQLMQDREEGNMQRQQQQQTGRRGSGDRDGKASLFRKLRRRSTLI
ncbi:hypothetical protein ACHAWU_003734 [Discostella pseudostelligera]|uniref:Protein kinase domain-containing protein n=1 Tax=Discostella pseudostelligera TaxID=259834 RepID=A0ABD3N623_9STRA